MVMKQSEEAMQPEDVGDVEDVERTKAPVHLPWMKQPRKGHKKKNPKAERVKKREQWLKQQQHRNQDAAEVAAVPADDPGADSPRRVRKVAPLGTFLPSTARRELQQMLQKRPSNSRRRGCRGSICTDALEQAKRLQCPFVWGLKPMTNSLSSLYDILDSTPYRGTPWHVAVEQIQVAYDFAGMGILWKSRELLEDVYAMLKVKEKKKGAAEKKLLHKYREGLKLVLDATWLLVRDDADARARRPLPDGTLAVNVVLFEELDDQQRASVYAIKALMSQGVDVEAADKALELDPSEGQWHYVKWLCLRAARARKMGVGANDLPPSAMEDALLRKAYSLRKTPPTVLAMAKTYVAGPGKNASMCIELIREAAELFPLSAYVFFHSGHLYKRLSRGKVDSRKIVFCFKMAIHLAQGSWMKANLDWGGYCMKNGRQMEGVYHLIKAGVSPCDIFHGDYDLD